MWESEGKPGGGLDTQVSFNFLLCNVLDYIIILLWLEEFLLVENSGPKPKHCKAVNASPLRDELLPLAHETPCLWKESCVCKMALPVRSREGTRLPRKVGCVSADVF